MENIISRKREILSIFLTVLLGFAIGCSTPAQRIDAEARRLSLERVLVKGTDFWHVVYKNAHQGDRLHIYLEGDGRPWHGRTRIALDPTPSTPLALRLMAQDQAPSVYLGRPCYHGQATVAPCHPLLWTSWRYSEQVVASMASALDRLLQQRSYRELVFIGYSGGGTLAMLLAERFESVRAVITIAGNLDIDRWTQWHAYSPLQGSLNPASRAPLPGTVNQLHLAGERDKNVPIQLIQGVVSRQPCAKVVPVGNSDHVCCWETTWFLVLKQLGSVLDKETKSCGISWIRFDRVKIP